jgi:uncharacterized repeat protein (TIGR01451 family)
MALRSVPNCRHIGGGLNRILSIFGQTFAERTGASAMQLGVAVIIRMAAILALVALPATAVAKDLVALDNQVFVERVSRDASGKSRVALEKPRAVAPGDRLVFVVKYRNTSPRAASKLVLTNPVPASIRFDGTADEGALVSLDGGATWGPQTGLNAARRSDVTHIRWKLPKALPAGASGKLIYRAVVR